MSEAITPDPASASSDAASVTSAQAGYAGQRVAYDEPALLEQDLADSPLAQFERWYTQACAAPVAEPNAMVLATVGAGGTPSARTMLLKQADRRGFVFFTNYGSRKAAELAEVPRAGIVFPWHAMARQVGVVGAVERLDVAESRDYFATRPWESRIGAWASHQSAPLADRAELEDRWAELARRWPDGGRPDDVPMPEHWGGYLLRPVEVEFWQGRPSRLHDRLVFLAGGVGQALPALDERSGWQVLRRQP